MSSWLQGRSGRAGLPHARTMLAKCLVGGTPALAATAARCFATRCEAERKRNSTGSAIRGGCGPEEAGDGPASRGVLEKWLTPYRNHY